MGKWVRKMLTANSVSIWIFQRFFFSEVPINSLHMPSLAWVIWSKILTPWSCQQSCHHARHLAHAVLMEIYPEVMISWVPWDISVFASKNCGKITWGLWKLLSHPANEKCKHRKLKNNIYVKHCLGYDYRYLYYEKWDGIKHNFSYRHRKLIFLHPQDFSENWLFLMRSLHALYQVLMIPVCLKKTH